MGNLENGTNRIDNNDHIDCPASELLKRLDHDDIIANLGLLKKIGVDINDVVDYLAGTRDALVVNLDALLTHGANATHLASKLALRDQLEYYDELKRHGAKLDEEKLLRYVKKHGNPGSIATVAIIIMDHGGDPSFLDALYAKALQRWSEDDE